MSNSMRPVSRRAMIFAANIRREATARGMSIRSIARAVGMPESTLYGKLNHRPGRISIREADDIAEVFGLLLTDLMRCPAS